MKKLITIITVTAAIATAFVIVFNKLYINAVSALDKSA